MSESAFGVDHGEVSKAMSNPFPNMPSALKNSMPKFKPLKLSKPKIQTPGAPTPGAAGKATAPGARPQRTIGGLSRPAGTTPGSARTPMSQKPHV